MIALSMLTACVSTDLNADHVKKERETYIGLQPFVQAGIASMETGNARAGVLLNESWDARLKKYEARLEAKSD